MIDWVSLATQDTALAWRAYRKLAEEERKGISLQRHFGSSVVQLQGRFWAGIEESRGLARAHGMMLQGLRVTRVDFAWDVPGAWMERARLELRGQVTTILSPTGTTLYAGSRESSRFLRIYDKRAEIRAKTGADVEFDLTRIEHETRREICRAYLALYEGGKADEILEDVITRYGLTFLDGNPGRRICVPGPEAGEPIEFVQRFYRVIGKALLADPIKFVQALELQDKIIIDHAIPF